MTARRSTSLDERRARALPRRGFLSLSLAATAVGVAGCGFSDSSSPQPKQPSGSGQSSTVPGGKGLTTTLREANRPVNHLNPVFGGGGSPQAAFLEAMMWEGLVQRDPDNSQKYLPGAAEKWEASGDGTTYTFHLRDGLSWSNGDPLTAKDFVWSYSYYFSPALGKQGNKNQPSKKGDPQHTSIKGMQDYYTGKTTDFSTVGVKAPDDHTLVFTLTGPDYQFLDRKVTTYPLHRKSVEAHPKDFWVAENFVGNGPYTLTAYKQNSEARLQLNEHYWDAKSYTVKDRRIQFNSGGSTGMMVSYNADEIDIFRVDGDPTALIAGRKDLQQQLKRAAVTQFKGLSVLPCKNPILQKNPKLRHALAMALDRDALAKVSPPDVAGPSWVPSGVTGYDKLPKIPFDPGQAKQLLADAGFADGKGVPKLQIVTYAKMPVLEAVGSMWSKHLGITTEIQVKEVGIFGEYLRGNLPDDFVGFTFNYRSVKPPMMLSLGGSNFNDYNYVPNAIAHKYYDLLKGKDKNKYSPAETTRRIDDLVTKNALPEYHHFRQLAKKALAAQADLAKANQLATEAAIAFQKTYLYIPLLWAGYTFMVKPRIHNLKLSSLADNMFTLKGVTLDPVKS